ncbi:unnamed protein product [Bursaphelenchus xylophilus]|uniref:(pine wood nematode) hypothetical protein n=1 Tax=Bursaphelenchus xylophilus TaxID=6326 RepID=A0A1I7RJ76_BURXY|nr:unnamed protein product [Bursaphelenchus xylophilus]CAG9119435.1 unnamed protein product [Bursaphelenchus xylophilus]
MVKPFLLLIPLLVFPPANSIDCNTAPTATLQRICRQLSKWDEGARKHPPPAKTALPPGIDESLNGLEIPLQAQTAFDCVTIGCLCGYLGGTGSSDDSHFCRLPDGSGVTKSRRKEYRMLSDVERRRLHSAIKTIKQRQGPGSYDFFASVHKAFDKAGAAHSGPAFLPWHREYLKRFEISLRLVDPQVNVPYWDSTLDSRIPDPKDSILWTDEFFGSSDANGWVVGGDFSPWRTIQGTDKIRRNLGGEGHPFNDTELEMLLNMPDIEEVLAFTAPGKGCPIRPNFYSLEYTHGNVHMFVGGDMYEQATSGNDPSFYFHHAFTDLIWETWRQLRQDRNSREVVYPLTQGSCASSYHTAGADMHPFGPWKNIDGLSNRYTDDFYEYAPRPTCSLPSKDCGSPYLFCLTSGGQARCASKIKLGGSCKGISDADRPCYQGMCVADECIPDPDYLKPDPVPTTSPPSKITPRHTEQSETCYNSQECCNMWAKEGQCEANKNYMREYCPASCGICTPVSYKLSDECPNRHIKCREWSAQGQCTKNTMYMNENCRKACNLCNIPKTCAKSTVSTTAPSAKPAATTKPTSRVVVSKTTTIALSKVTTTAIPHSITPQQFQGTAVSWGSKCTSPGCNNENMCCQHWANQGECRKNPIYMMCWCRVSCGVCTPTDYSYGDCADYNSQCAEWSKRGECDKNPWMLENCRQSCGTCLTFKQLKQTCEANGGKKRLTFEAKIASPTIAPTPVPIPPSAPPDLSLQTAPTLPPPPYEPEHHHHFAGDFWGHHQDFDHPHHHHQSAESSWGAGYAGPSSGGYGRPRFYDGGWGRWGREVVRNNLM